MKTVWQSLFDSGVLADINEVRSYFLEAEAIGKQLNAEQKREWDDLLEEIEIEWLKQS